MAAISRLFFRDDHHRHAATQHLRRSLDLALLGQHFGHLIHDRAAIVHMHHFPPAKQHGKLHFMTFFEEFNRAVDLDVPIMIINFGPQSNLFKGYGMLFFLAQLQFALLLIEMLTIIHDPTHRGFGVWRHLDKVQTQIMSFKLGILHINQPYLVIIFIDQPNRARSNPLINA